MTNSGVKFAWIKATEGGDRADERFEAELGRRQGGRRRARRLSLRLLVPGADGGNELFRAERAGRADALPPVLDVEATPTPGPATAISQEGAIADMKVMLEEMERHYGKRPVIYTSVDFYEAILSDGAFSDYSIWVRSTKHHPAVRYGSRAWQFWQYQADGPAPGIVGHVDRNVFYGTPEQWQAFLRGNGLARRRAG